VADRGPAVRGLDLSPEMARLAARRLGGAVTGDLLSLPIASRSVDGVVPFYALIHLRRTEQERAWRDTAHLRRVLRWQMSRLRDRGHREAV
jgi:ubiquinone/menaquinone biosynthesis C-methylase UbiE